MDSTINTSKFVPLPSHAFKFEFTRLADKIIIEISNQYDTMQYIGSITAHPNIDFDLIQDILDQGQYTVLIRNQKILKLKVGPVVVELDCKFRLKTQKLQNQIDHLLETKLQLQTSLKTLKKQIQALKNAPKENPQILLVQSPIKWSNKLKSTLIKINKRFATKSQKSQLYEFALLETNLSQKIQLKQNWALKIKNKTSDIMIGVCLKKMIQKGGFNDKEIDWTVQNHGCYAINSQGWAFSFGKKVTNNQQTNFKFDVGDVVFMEYDPVNGRLKFNLNKDEGEFLFDVYAPPSNDKYHPFVALKGEKSFVQFMLAGEPMGETFLSRFIRKYFINF